MFDVRVSAGGREVNTSSVMATITVLMMKIPYSLEMREKEILGGGEEGGRTTKSGRCRKQFEEMKRKQRRGRKESNYCWSKL